jgi:2-oxoglutarate dehydrogenase E2 component (dihydrolipoamide succinyltransferase)
VLRWCKAAGDAVRKDEPLLELETDKVTVEIPSPVTGKLTEILKQPNEEVVPGQILARVSIARASEAGAAQRPAERAAAAAAREPASQDGAQPLSPAVRRLLNDHALSAEELTGSGRNGRITVQDVERFLDRKSHESAATGDADTTAKMRRPPGIAAAEVKRDDARRDDARRIDARRIPHSAVRRRVAEHMARSLAQAPHVTTLFEADLTRVQAHRARHASEYERRGIRLTLTAYFVAACARALIAHPTVNATFHEDALELHPDANIGVGTALGNEGLIVPVIHQAQHMSLQQLAARLGQLVGAARAGRLAPQEVRGGTFTISNHGVGGSLLAAPIVINQPQVAILGVGKVERRVCVVNTPDGESIGVRTMCYLTLTIDHRAIDAFQANGFLEHVVKTLEHWNED